MRSARTDVRSNMVNGMPRRRLEAEDGASRRTYSASNDDTSASRTAVA